MRMVEVKKVNDCVVISDDALNIHPTVIGLDEVPQLVKDLTQYIPETTNLNFWQAYQAMKCGEWVGNDEVGGVENHHYEIDKKGRFLFVENDDPLEIYISSPYLNSTAWYIVPKGPRYKVGDRFELPKAPSMPDHILTIIAAHDDEYAAQVTSERHGHIRFQSIQERTLDGFTKLPS